MTDADFLAGRKPERAERLEATAQGRDSWWLQQRSSPDDAFTLFHLRWVSWTEPGPALIVPALGAAIRFAAALRID
jgi:hypothetical protein